jgi:hypothetical protein
MPLLTNSFLRVSPSPSAFPLRCQLQEQLRGAPKRGLTTAQTQDLEVISQRWLRERKQSRRKEHSFIIRMRNEETDPLVQKFGEAAFRYAHCVVP